MRKLYLLVGSVALGVGLVIGAVGYALATTPTDDNSRLTFWNKDSQSTVGTIDGSLGDSTTGSAQNPITPNSELFNPDLPYPFSPEEDTMEPGGQEADDTTTPIVIKPDVTIPKPNQGDVPEALAQEILTDYKLNVATLFEAWKSPDMETFRAELKEAYTGDLFERHARQAEPFITKGVGIEVSDISFDNAKVDTATSTTATLTASYNYTAQDYDLGNQIAIGENTLHQVKVRVNMVKSDTRWLITGETIL